MRIGVLIPTRGDRPELLGFATKQIEGQSRKPDEVIIIDEPPKNEKPDITYRYRIGCERLKNKVDAILFWEDDDYYRHDYIERMERAFVERPSADIIGANSTVYYNIVTRKWAEFRHPGRASMFSTGIRTRSLDKLKWCEDSYSYTDLHLWKSLSGVAFDSPGRIAIGIKHGIGLTGGGGHVSNWRAYDKYDPRYEDLLNMTDETAVNFYSSLTIELRRYSLRAAPLVSILTRVMLGKRNGLFQQHLESVERFTSTNYEQVFIIDRIGVGMLNANKSFQFAKPRGRWVHLCDDDDFYTDPNFVEEVEKLDKAGVDVGIFKCKILTGDGDEMYPKPESWNTRAPKRGQIGGSCIVFRRWVYDRYMHTFSLPSFGDWNFITRVLADPKVKAVWVDKKIVETGKVSRGRPE